jgi:hypothetical protein
MSKNAAFFSKPIEEKDAWILSTYRNTTSLPAVRTDDFFSLEDARAYILKTEPTTPLISRKRNPLEIPENIDEILGHIPEAERPWEFYNRWLKDHNLFGAISAGFPTKNEHHCPYRLDERGYTSKHWEVTSKVYVDGVEEVFYENGNTQHEITWVGGSKHGPATDYYENGQVKVKGNYYRDCLHGSYERFHENG